MPLESFFDPTSVCLDIVSIFLLQQTCSSFSTQRGDSLHSKAWPLRHIPVLISSIEMWTLFLVFFALERSNKWDTLFILLYHKTVFKTFHSEFWLLSWMGTEWQKDRCYCYALISTVLDYFGGEGCGSVKEYLPHTYKDLALIHITRKTKSEMVFQALTYCICLMPVLKQDHKSYWKVGMVAPTCSSSTWEPEVGGWPWVRSQSYRMRTCLKINTMTTTRH